jgi:hypothetical protein
MAGGAACTSGSMNVTDAIPSAVMMIKQLILYCFPF